MLGWIDVVSGFLSSQGLGVMIGGLIAAGATFFLEKQRHKYDETKRRQERFDQEIQRRNDDYIKFLSLKPDTSSYDPVTQRPRLVGNVGLESALVLAYGSVGVALELAQSYPFQSWNNVKAVQDKTVEELRDERIGRGTLRPPNLTRSSKHWWQFRRRRE